MFIGKHHEISRRAFLERTGKLAITGTAGAYALGLSGLGEAAAFSSDGGYKALVCVFLYGGNDHANTLIPYDPTNYQRYANIRRDVALPRNSLASTLLIPRDNQTLTDDMALALAPTMPRLKSRFDEGKLAVLLNVGPLEAPITRAQYESGNTKAFPRPRKLFSHNDQQATWQSSEVEGGTTGWGGRMGDLAQSANTNAMFTAINVSGNAVFLSGNQTLPFRISSRGPVQIDAIKANSLYRSSQASEALREVISNHHQHVFEQDYAAAMMQSLTYSPFVSDTLLGASNVPSPIADNPLSTQLNIVARLIEARERMGVTRQVFFVSLGGFDHHSNLLGSHEGLLGLVDQAVDQFYQTTKRLGVAESVTTFTASDFGRTLTPNGNGSDHGWGAHHFILGGAVDGGRFYGRAPKISVTSDEQVGRGRLLPTISVDEYSTTLARWFGVSPSELPSIAPNIGRFANPNLGFMRASTSQ
ncbi:Tat pathway signal protein [Erythrobacter sp. JL475]|nr:Tat pathway signal protein [Erythrobacter sp. JL475]